MGPPCLIRNLVLQFNQYFAHIHFHRFIQFKVLYTLILAHCAPPPPQILPKNMMCKITDFNDQHELCLDRSGKWPVRGFQNLQKMLLLGKNGLMCPG